MNRTALIVIAAAFVVGIFAIYFTLSGAPQEEPPVVQEGPSSENQQPQAPPGPIINEGPAVVTVPVTLTRTLFNPNTIAANRGDTVVLVLTSADGEHGIYVADYGLNVVIASEEQKSVQLSNVQGDMEIVCNVNCANGNILYIDVQ